MLADTGLAQPFPPPLDAYPAAGSLAGQLAAGIEIEPFNAIATAIFVLAVVHTFVAARFTSFSHRLEQRRAEQLRSAGLPPRPGTLAGLFHFLGEVEVVFGLWAAVLLVALVARKGWSTATHYLNDTVNYTEPLFVIVVMALASTRPVIEFAEGALRRLAALGGGSPRAWWIAILTVGPLLGSLITEPAAMTICALLLARQFYDLDPSPRLRYATLGLLFVNVSIGGTLTHFAAPPILVVARTWEWTTPFLLRHFGWRAILAIALSVTAYALLFRRELAAMADPDVASGRRRARLSRAKAMSPSPFPAG